MWLFEFPLKRAQLGQLIQASRYTREHLYMRVTRGEDISHTLLYHLGLGQMDDSKKFFEMFQYFASELFPASYLPIPKYLSAPGA